MHLDDTTLDRFVRGELGGVPLAAADEHLDSCDDCRVLVCELAKVVREDTAELGLDRGARVGRYVIGDHVGDGAMGVVYAAWDPELDRRVALKITRGAAADPARAKREAQAMARLAHPNVVTVHEVGTFEGHVFLAMELVTGTTLAEWARGKPWDRVCDVMIEVGRGLAAAHDAGVVHRDVKPENIIVGEDGRARIGDFGLAAGAAPAAGREGSSRTGLAGTPVYMAPEVLGGEIADAASDQFSFAVTFFEALHGRRPFEGKSLEELARAIRERTVARPRDRVPAWLDAMVRRGLSADRGDRWPSVRALVEAIVRRRARRFIGVAGGIAAAALASAATAAVLLGRRPIEAGGTCGAAITDVWNPTARSEIVASLTRVETPYAEAAAAGVTRELDAWAATYADADAAVCRTPTPVRQRCLTRRRDALSVLVSRLRSADREVAARAVDAVRGLPSPAECASLEEDGADPLPTDAALRAEVERIQRDVGALDVAVALGDAGAAQTGAQLVARAEGAAHLPTLAEARRAQGAALRLAGKLDAADAMLHEALFAAQSGHDDRAAAAIWIDLAAVAGDRRDIAAVDERTRHATAALDRIAAPAPMRAALTTIRGLAAHNRGDIEGAEALLSEALDAWLDVGEEDATEVARVRSALGHVARVRGDLAQARAHHEAALDFDLRRLGEGHPAIARDLHNLAGVVRLAGDLTEAWGLYQRALVIERASLGERHPQTAMTRNSLSLIHLARGELDEAQRELDAARSILEEAGSGDRALVVHNLGLVAQRRGDHDKALERFDEAALLYRETVGDHADGPVRLLLDRAESEQALGRSRDAANNARRARERASALPSQTAREVKADAAKIESPSPAPPKERDTGMYGSGQAWR